MGVTTLRSSVWAEFPSCFLYKSLISQTKISYEIRKRHRALNHQLRFLLLIGSLEPFNFEFDPSEFQKRES